VIVGVRKLNNVGRTLHSCPTRFKTVYFNCRRCEAVISSAFAQAGLGGGGILNELIQSHLISLAVA
jgi:hypothetical protein